MRAVHLIESHEIVTKVRSRLQSIMSKRLPFLRVFLLLLIPLACPVFAQAQPKVSINDVTVLEGTQPGTTTTFAVFSVNLSSPLADYLFVPIAVHDQTAKRGLDFLWNNDFAIFRPGTLTTTVRVQIIGDSLPEGDETFTLELLPPTGILGGRTIGTCTILDDDNAVSPLEQRVAEGEKGQINIRLTDPAVADETVILQTDAPALLVVPGSVTIPAGAPGVTVEFTCLNRVGAGSIMVTLPLSGGGRTYVLSVAVH
ncbi:MAG TPA: Calx-beta domain-containing protein, partial [Thermoanaerobaculia bacterium]